MSRRRIPEPAYTPPTDVERDMGYALDCPGCGREWSMRYVDMHTMRCLPCFREWRRDDMAARRRGVPGGSPLASGNEHRQHPFTSRVLRREVDLNSLAARELLVSNAEFRAEVSRYVDGIVEKNSRPDPPLRGVLPLLAGDRGRSKAQRVDIPDEEPPPADAEIGRAVDRHIDLTMNTVDAEIVTEGDDDEE